MKIGTIRDLLDARVIVGEERLGDHVYSACGSDMMSDVLAYVKDQAVLLTGLVNAQVVRTAEMMDMHCIVFVRSKEPTEEIIRLAEESGMVLLATDKRMYDACGILYSNGLVGNKVKKDLRRLGLPPETIRRVSIAMYEGEINMVIHAGGGHAEVRVTEDAIEIVLEDHGPGIANIPQAMQAGFSTAPDNVRSLGFGAGMGLPNMKRYTDYMDIQSKVGEGTRVTMRVNLQ